MQKLAERADAQAMRSGARILAAVVAAAACAPSAAVAAPPPDDPLFDQQWALARESVLGRAAAWQQSTGAGALVAVLDTGADLDHPDLRGALWANPAEVAGNGVDDDRNGFVDDVHGADVVNDDGDPDDDEGHGTHVAGIVAARANDATGVAGLAPDSRVMVVKVLDERRAGTAAGLAEGIRYAVAQGAQIINTSVNGEGTSRVLQEAIRAAGAAGALVVASAGNDARSLDLRPSYPASYDDAAIVSVGSVGEAGALSAFSNHGRLSVDLAAPGESILSTADEGGYELRSGTSMAAPLVSATLALLQASRPGLRGAPLKEALLAGTRRDDPVAGLLGGGALDAGRALRAVAGSSAAPLVPAAVSGLAATRARRGAILSWALGGDAAGVAAVRVVIDARAPVERASSAFSRLRVRARPGLHHWRVTAVDAAGETLAEAAGTFRVRRADWPLKRPRG